MSRGDFVFTRLQYDSGDWDLVDPRMPSNLIDSLVAYTTIRVDQREATVSLASPAVFEASFCYLSGHKLVQFSERERENFEAYVRVVESEAPEIATVYLTGRRRDGASQPAAVHAAGGRVWSPNFEALDTAALIEARKLELAVVPWTVNEPGYIERFLDLNVDGLITDHPERVRAELARRGLPLPPSTPVER
jgi:hypothetical protein